MTLQKPEPDDVPSITVAEAGRRGGNEAKLRMLKIDPEYYSRIGKLGGDKTRATHTDAHYAQIGKIGGKANAVKQSHEAAVQRGKKGGDRTADLIAKGKKAEADG